MDQSYHLFALKEIFAHFAGPHYPKEIVYFIMTINRMQIKFSCGSTHISMMKNNKLYVCGDNSENLIKYDAVSSYKNFTEIKLDIKKVSSGGWHNVALSLDPKKIYVWGFNSSGQLGLGHCEKIMTYGSLEFKEAIKSIKGSMYGAYVLTKCGAIYGWGSNAYGQVGLGDHKQFICSPTKIFLQPIKKIYDSYTHVFVLASDGKIYCWGNNSCGQLGLGHKNNVYTPQEFNLYRAYVISCGEYHTVALTIDKKIYGWGLICGEYEKGFSVELPLSNIVSIKCGSDHTLGLNMSGEIYIWPSNYYDQPHKLDLSFSIKKIICKYNNHIAIADNNKIYVWGNNWYGQLGLGNTNIITEPTELIIEEK